MKILEQKHRALLAEATRRGHSDTAPLRLCFELLSLSAAIDKDCATRLSPHKLSEGKFVVLFLLHDQSDGVSPHTLAQQAGVTPATITGLLDGLERDGFLGRNPGLTDRRKISVRLTPFGQTITTELFTQHSQWISTLFTNLTAEERETFSRLLLKVWANTDAGKRDQSSDPQP